MWHLFFLSCKVVKLNNNGKKWLSIKFNTDNVIKWRNIRKNRM